MILCLDGYSERTMCAVTSLGKQYIILRFTWLAEHNPEINWQTHKVAMSQFPDKCQADIWEEQKTLRMLAEHIQVCR